jgi:hypothetical protein
MSKANQSVVIHLDSEGPGALRIRTIPPLSELDAMRNQPFSAMTQAELYALAALVGIEDMRSKLRQMEAAACAR